MPIEIEAKMKLDDPAALSARLSTQGAERGPSVFEVNTYYDTADGSMKATDQGLRIRVATTHGPADREPQRSVIITHKGPREHGQLKSRTETEMRATDGDDAAALLRSLGFVPVLTFEKRREVWRVAGCEVDIDHLPLLGDYVEIEGPGDEQVLAVRTQLGLDEAPIVRGSYIGLLMDHLVATDNPSRYVTLRDSD